MIAIIRLIEKYLAGKLDSETFASLFSVMAGYLRDDFLRRTWHNFEVGFRVAELENQLKEGSLFNSEYEGRLKTILQDADLPLLGMQVSEEPIVARLFGEAAAYYDEPGAVPWQIDEETLKQETRSALEQLKYLRGIRD